MPRFVVHLHFATHKHWDFRLELDNTLKSWAVPKEPPRKGGIKRLPVQVDDHPTSYIDFQGVIEEGYGKGSVEIWDKGKFELIDKKDGKIVFNLHGKRMKGEYVLLRFKTKGEKRAGKNWLLFKK